jgi:hypothetical protein
MYLDYCKQQSVPRNKPHWPSLAVMIHPSDTLLNQHFSKGLSVIGGMMKEIIIIKNQHFSVEYRRWYHA